MNTRSSRSRLVRLAASGLLLSGMAPLGAAEYSVGATAIVSPAPCGQSSATASHWQMFWDRFRDPCATITPGAIPAPAGSSVRAWDNLMADRAKADRFVVYQHEWYMGGVTLGPYGCSHVQRIAAALPHQPGFLLLQPELSPEVNETRRLQLVHLLQSEGVADAEQRVVVAYPTAEGMWSEEAARSFNRGHTGTGGVNGAGAGAGINNLAQPNLGGFMPFGGLLGGVRGSIGGY
jgi:hypothetical protein